jgi:hypothetical protein
VYMGGCDCELKKEISCRRIFETIEMILNAAN